MKYVLLSLALFITVSSLSQKTGTDDTKLSMKDKKIPAPKIADSLDIKIGQLIIFGFYGRAVHKKDPVYKAVKEGKVGSILIYGRNIAASKTSDSLRRLIAGFQQVAPIPLFVSIDQEGGLVNRLPQRLGFPEMPSAYYLGRKDNTETTKNYSDNIANTLAGLQINLNYAPVLDLHNAQCPVLGARERCFSAEPEKVTEHAATVIRSHDKAAVHTVLKHFPGHGNAAGDSHFGVTDVTKTWQPEELVPYKSLIEAGLADGIMTAHIVNFRLDPTGLPATLSRPMITGLLRDSLGFNGVIFSDDMMMQAISAQYGLRDALYKALHAGVDVLMFSNNIRGVAQYAPGKVHALIKELVISGKISAERIDASFRRVMAMKQKWQSKPE